VALIVAGPSKVEQIGAAFHVYCLQKSAHCGYVPTIPQVPPETCYGIDCSSSGVCITVHNSSGRPHGKCACLTGYSGSACETKDQESRRSLSGEH
jgi:hypothetical protein